VRLSIVCEEILLDSNGGCVDDSRRKFNLYEGDEVTVLAREKARSCVIFTDLDGDKQVGWVSTNYLSDTK
jgi:hypothetical protein